MKTSALNSVRHLVLITIPHRLKRLAGISFLLLFTGLAICSGAPTVSYTIVDLGALADPRGINNSGRIVGAYDGTSAWWNASSPPTVTGLKPLTNTYGVYSSGGLATGINTAGYISGIAEIEVDPVNYPEVYEQKAFIWAPTGGSTYDTGTSVHVQVGTSDDLPFEKSGGWGINGNDEVVGLSWPSLFRSQIGSGLVSNPASMVSAGDPYRSWAHGGSPGNGYTVGDYLVAETYVDCLPVTTQHAYIYSGSTQTGLGWVGGTSVGPYTNASALAVNDNAFVVGWSVTVSDPDVVHACAWSNALGTILRIDLGTLGAGNGQANSVGPGVSPLVVGNSAGHAFVWDGTNGMSDLNNLVNNGANWVLNNATGISGTGQIVGSGTYNGQSRGFRLDP